MEAAEDVPTNRMTERITERPGNRRMKHFTSILPRDTNCAEILAHLSPNLKGVFLKKSKAVRRWY